jgi:hypothetical protein
LNEAAALSKFIIASALFSGLACSSASTDPGSEAGSAGARVISGGAGAGASTAGAGNTGGAGAGSGAGAAGEGGTAAAGAAAGGAAAGSAGMTGGAGSAGMTGFVHPGILVNKGMLDFVKGKIAAGSEPWNSALAHASSSNFGSLSYTPHPRATVECGPISMPDLGCTDEKNDVIAAFTHALIWYHTGDQKHADKAIQIMNAWSAVLKSHTNDNAQLQASWAAEVFPRAAEIIRYSGAGWSEPDIEKFTAMLKTAYLPQVGSGSTRTGNWDTSAIEAAMNIAVFTEDQAEFTKAVKLWHDRTPAYIYLTTDGALPVQPPRESPRSDSSLKGYWFNPKQFIDGLTQESCRDLPNSGTAGFGHAQYGVAAIINAAETARIQGVDLFASEQKRLTAMLELHSKYLNGASISALCNTAIAPVDADPMWEIGYNAYANVLGQALPETLKLVKSIRPTDATHHMAWETLTHGDIASAGL